jgi:hypothetical protein
MQFIRLQFFTAVILVLVVVGCGPTKIELAEREAYYAARRAELTARQTSLKERADRIVATGGEHPSKPMRDPGYPIVNVISPKLPDDAIAVEGFGVPSSSNEGHYLTWNAVICGNTKAGREILNWRRWYCKGEDQACIYSKWENGEPTFGYYLVDRPDEQGNVIIKLPGIQYEFAPMATPLNENQ